MPRRDYIEFQDRTSPVGFLITFRCYGTWLHGDERGSFDRHHRRYGTRGLPASDLRQQRDRGLLKQPPVTLNPGQRVVVELSIRETCELRSWRLWTINVRTNHVHAVVSANKKPESILSGLKANATRALKETELWTSKLSPWSFGGSKKYLWDEKQLTEAIAYVDDAQGKQLD